MRRIHQGTVVVYSQNGRLIMRFVGPLSSNDVSAMAKCKCKKTVRRVIESLIYYMMHLIIYKRTEHTQNMEVKINENRLPTYIH